jgi:hypothetical protein
MTQKEVIDITTRIEALFKEYTDDVESRIKFLEDNAFSDRARIGVLENKIEQLDKKKD